MKKIKNKIDWWILKKVLKSIKKSGCRKGIVECQVGLIFNKNWDDIPIKEREE